MNVDQSTRQTALTDVEAGSTVTVPVAVYLITVWAIHFRYKKPGLIRDIAAPLATALILGTSWTSEPVLATGVILAALVTLSVAFGHRSSDDNGSHRYAWTRFESGSNSARSDGRAETATPATSIE